MTEGLETKPDHPWAEWTVKKNIPAIKENHDAASVNTVCDRYRVYKQGLGLSLTHIHTHSS